MKKILIIGIGAGNPEYVTIQAVNALNQVDVFFILEKGAAMGKLLALRKEICQRYITHSDYRFVQAQSPARIRPAPDHVSGIEDLNRDKEALFEQLIAADLADGECGAFLIWGDPALYDSTVRIIETIAERGNLDLEYEVIPGISSIQALAARHKITLNQIGAAVEITTGRKLAEGFPEHVESVVVMLDEIDAYKLFVDQDIDIYWGAYVGTPDEILISGKLKDVAGEIERTRAEARLANGWIMDSYLLRRAASPGSA